MSNVAELEYVAGEESVIDEWDIPNSHADHKARDKECACEYGDIEYAYSDCPITDTHTWNEESGKEGQDVGVIAQEILEVLPEAVTTRENGYLAVRYEKLAGIIIQAINELADEVDKLK